MTRQVYLSLGTNLGDREHNLRTALHLLRREVEIDAISSLYETDPVGVVDQPPFLNIAAGARTALDPHDLLRFVKDVEHQAGRRPTRRWGPRVVDVDILLVDDLVITSPNLTVPHPEMVRRAFVLVPLAEIGPDLRHPCTDRSIRELAMEVGERGVRLRGALKQR